MKVFVAGSTGVLGRRLVQQFAARGDAVVGLVRSPAGAATVAALGGESRQADLFDADALARAADGCEVVIHAATAIPTGDKAAPADWETNDRIRREGTQALAECAARVGASHYVQQSVIWVARPPDGSFFDESSPARPAPYLRSALDGENIARETGERHGFGVSVLRCGWFYAADAAHTRKLGQALAARRLPIIGRGDAVWSCLHADDAAGAFVTAATAGRTGLWHVVDDRPVTVGELLATFARRLGAPRPWRLPAWLVRLLAGPGMVAAYSSSSRTSNSRFRADFGWQPSYPTIAVGIDQVVASWAAEGFQA